jgi:hypothetical protein
MSLSAKRIPGQKLMVPLVSSVTRLPFLAKAVWTNAKFGGIKDIPGLEQYDYCLHVRLPKLQKDISDLLANKVLSLL